MRTTVKKMAVSVPADLYREMERARRGTGQSRSAAVQEALRRWLKERDEERARRSYADGYRRQPESQSEVEAAEASAVRLLSTQEWE